MPARLAAAALGALLPLMAAQQCPVCPQPGEVGGWGMPNASAVLGVDIAPVGNPPATKSSFALHGTTGQDSEREFLVSLGLVSNRGARASPTPGTIAPDKVALYAATVAEKGTGDVWAINPLVTQYPGSGAYNAQGVELDFNNLNEHRGEADAGAGLAAPVSYGLSVTGAGNMRSTAAIGVFGPIDHRIWNRGIVFANDCVEQSTFQDLGNPAKSIDIRGAAGYGVYQANTATKNFFAGGTGFGTEDPAAAVDVRGDVRYTGRLLRSGAGGAADQHHVTSPHPAVLHAGKATLGADGGADVRLPAAPPGGEEWAYSLTAIGLAMPGLHVGAEAAAAAGGAAVFRIAGGAPGGRVSWHVTQLPAGV